MAEQRCTDLAGDCECSEPFQATAYDGGPNVFNPNDTSSQQCTYSLANYPIDTNAVTPVVGSDSAVLAKLPAGHSVARYLRFADGHTGIVSVGHRGISSAKDRMAHRWYHYWSADSTLDISEGCNAKLIETDPIIWNSILSQGIALSNTSGKFTPDIDCCSNGPGSTWSGVYADLKDHWWRLEVVQTGMGGPDYRCICYARNITDDEEEVVFFDIWAFNNGLTPNSTVDGLHVNLFRSNQGGTCDGWAGISHFMAASWDTDSGQRIGAASEIEGGGEGGGETVGKSSYFRHRQRMRR
jgi:hypothetical protein